MKTFIASLLFSVAAAVPAADDIYKVEGKIAELHVAHVENGGQDFRIILADKPAMCGNAWTTAYVSEDHRNYEALVNALIGAKVQQSPVIVVSKRDTTGYCRIIYLMWQ